MTIYDAAYRRMAGDRDALVSVGVGDGTEGLGLAYRAHTIVYDAMTACEREAQRIVAQAALDSLAGALNGD